MDLRLVALEVEEQEEEEDLVAVADHSRVMGLQEDDSELLLSFCSHGSDRGYCNCEWMSFFSGGGLGDPTFFGCNCALVASQVFPFESLPHLSLLLL